MKIILGIILLSASTFAFGQKKVDCSEVKTGKFRLMDEEIGTTLIKRTKTKQIENNKELKVKAKYDVVWIDDCTYQLKNPKRKKGDAKFIGQAGQVITVKILWIEDGVMRVKSSANFADIVVESNIEVL